jgi:DNA polymerase-4
VLHIDIDAFFASVEELRNPYLRGQPVAVGSGVVASANYIARRFGLRAGTPLRKARNLCPGLIILPGHAPIYRCFSERIFELCTEYAPGVETYLDEAYCDWSGTDRLYPDQVNIAAELRHRIVEEVGLTVTAGIGRNRMFAKMASKSAKPDGLQRILPSEEEGFLCGLPTSHLPGVGPTTEKLLTKLNVRTVGEMRLLSRESLRGMLGLPGLVLYERCRGEDTQPVSRREIPRSIRRETSFHQDEIDRETIEGTLYYLLERAANTMRKLRLRARQVGVKIRYSAGEGEGKDSLEAASTRKLPSPTQRDSELFSQALKILKTLYTRRVALRLVGAILTGFVPDSGLRQLELFSPGDDSPCGDEIDGRERYGRALDGRELGGRESLDAERRELKLLESLDRIRERYGYAAVVCGKSLNLLGKVMQDDHGFVLRTPSLTK